jgi:hypothetical protein
MNEKIFNLYSIVQKGFLTHLGIKAYYASGTEKEKQKILIERAERDYVHADIYTVTGSKICVPFSYEEERLAESISYDAYRQMAVHEIIHIFDIALKDKEASTSPLLHVSLIVDGKFVCR